MSTSPTLTIALFGATGGTGLSVLKNLLAANYTVRVLARTPSKLSNFSSNCPNLTIIKGDIRSLPSLKETLLSNGRVVDLVISAIGMVFQRQGLKFSSVDTYICEDGTRHIISALTELETKSKPDVQLPEGGTRLILLSTTGISETGRDIPVAMVPLYHWLLSIPHKDKKKMEDLVVASKRRFVIVRPSLLMDGKEQGMKKVRVGVATPGKKLDEGKLEIGYTINREDVGRWIVEKCVKEDGKNWEGKFVTLTY
jgi:nucleoside-diphosphate-sugar epimerase